MARGSAGVPHCTGGCAGFDLGASDIGSETYPSSVIMRLDPEDARGFTTWNALGECSTCSATVGLTNDSPNTTSTFRLSLDEGQPMELASLRTGDSIEITADISGAFRIKLESFGTPYPRSGVPARAAWGDARMICTNP